MLKISTALLSTVFALSAPVLSASAAHAADPGLPIVVSPADGTSVPSGEAVRIVLDLSQVAASPTDLRVDLDCGGTRTTLYTGTYSADPVTYDLPGRTGPQTCAFSSQSDLTNEDYHQIGTLQVAAPATTPDPPTDPDPIPDPPVDPPTDPVPTPEPTIAFSNLSISATSFYPRVVDGYRDTVVTRWGSNRVADTTVSILNSRGTVVRRAAYSAIAAGSHMWTWNGRTSAGTAVPTGAYRVRISATADGVTRTFTKAVTVATALVNRSGSARRSGYDSYDSASRNCYVTGDSYYETTTLDCWGGKYARATYNFRVPASAFNVHWSARGWLTDADICCTGRVTRTGRRLSSTLFQVRAQVNGWRAFEVESAAVSYTYKVRR